MDNHDIFTKTGMEHTIYNMFDLLAILKSYCAHNGKKDDKMKYVESLLDNFSDELEKLA